MNRLTDKKALIFGADGITQGIAERFVQEGVEVTVIDTPSALDAFGTNISTNTGVILHAINNREAATIADGIDEVLVSKNLDILVIGGGDIPAVGKWMSIDEVDATAFGSGVERETAAAFAAAKAAGPALQRNGGSVIFLFNPAGLYSEGGWGEETAAHHAKRGLARTLAMEWGQYQIRVNTLVPLARTAGFEDYRSRNPDLVDWRVSKTAMQRAGDPVRDIGGAAVFLASDDTRYLTGSMIFADGGAFLGLTVVETTMPAA